MGFTLSTFSIWKDIEIWGSLFIFFCEKRAKEQEETENQELLRSKNASRKGFLLLKGFGKAMGDIWSTKMKKYSLTSDYLSQNYGSFYEGAMEDVSFSMLGLDIEYDLAVGMLTTLMRRYGIDKTSVSKVFELQEQRRYSAINQQKTKRKEEAGKWGKIYHVRAAVEFLDPKEPVLQLLLVCREWHEKLKRPLMRLVLLHLEDPFSTKRKAIWTKIAEENAKKKTAEIQKEFEGLKENELCLAPAIESVINVDVQRSFHDHKDFDHKALKRILRRTAHFHRETYSYYQGMNYIVGFLLLFYKEEQRVYGFFNLIMQGAISGLYKNDFADLYIMFYQFDRLLSIFCPHITAHFNVNESNLEFQLVLGLREDRERESQPACMLSPFSSRHSASAFNTRSP